MPAGAVSRAERIGNVELNPLRSALLCRPYVGPSASLVAQDPVRDLFVSAEHLFVAANVAEVTGKRLALI